MVHLSFEKQISAPAEQVWKVMWDDAAYRKWTSVFSEGSHAISEWQEGSRIEFLDGKGGGMYSVIEKMHPGREMTFKHLGEIKDGNDQPSNWDGARESYYFSEESGITRLRVELDSTEEFQEYMQDVFPKALEILKQLAETTFLPS